MQKSMIKRLAATGVVLLGLGGTGAVIAQSPAITVQATSIKVSQSAVVKKFTKKFKDAKIESISLEKENGRYVYEIDGFTKSKEHSMKINASSGKVIRTESKKLDDHKKSLNLKKTISRSTATKIAQKRAKGAKATEWTLDREGNKSVWDITLKKGHKEYEVQVNALTKKVIKVEVDD